MIRRLLIANRGEIAVRIARCCRELGVESVAIHSDADTRALHVRTADRAIRIGPPPARDSYLSIERIIDAARSTGADAIHPGYGFLAENPEFADACGRAGLIFIGPSPDVLGRMGSKIAARRLMAEAGVPIVPGETPADQSDEGVRRAVDAVGYPALIKPSEGGGGKGMHRVESSAEVIGAVQTARREAEAAFGDGTLYVERLIPQPRHVEVQVFGDTHGQVVHLFERDCSTQRRHQKVIEESPSPFLPDALRRAITAAAVKAARAVSYVNAGTVEFLVDTSSRKPSFHFLEMNTRLQVEHPVTEQVVGVDLVRAQLLVASGERLPWEQQSLQQRGHAVEARVYAEDPAHDFMPQAGRLLLYREPRMPGVRVDSGFVEGADVPVHYDPLLAKVIAWAENRELAIDRLAAALRSFPILGIATNIPFLLDVLNHPRFRAGDVHVTFLEKEEWTTSGDRSPVLVREMPASVRAAIDTHLSSGLSNRAAVSQPLANRTGWDPWDSRLL